MGTDAFPAMFLENEMYTYLAGLTGREQPEFPKDLFNYWVSTQYPNNPNSRRKIDRLMGLKSLFILAFFTPVLLFVVFSFLLNPDRPFLDALLVVLVCVSFVTLFCLYQVFALSFQVWRFELEFSEFVDKIGYRPSGTTDSVHEAVDKYMQVIACTIILAEQQQRESSLDLSGPIAAAHEKMREMDLTMRCFGLSPQTWDIHFENAKNAMSNQQLQ